IGTAQTLNAGAQASISTSSLTLGTHLITADYGGDANFAISNGSLSGGQVVGSTIQFSAASYAVSETGPRVDITLTRGGNVTSSASVNFVTNDGAGLTNCDVINHIASPRCDYINTLGTMTFAAGETSKSFSVAIIDDSYAEGAETFTISLNNPSGAGWGTQTTATVTIIDNDLVTGPNRIDQAGFFVTEHYYDFLNRFPDSDVF